MKIYRTAAGWLLETAAGLFQLPPDKAENLTTREDLPEYLQSLAQSGGAAPRAAAGSQPALLPPMEN